jgi:hypothetical protein
VGASLLANAVDRSGPASWNAPRPSLVKPVPLSPRVAFGGTGFSREEASVDAGSSADRTRCLWEILWFSSSQNPRFRLVFALIFHQGERDPSEFAAKHNKHLGSRFSAAQVFVVELFPGN